MLRASAAGSGPRVSTSSAAPCGPTARRPAGIPGLSSTERRAARSASSTAATGAWARRLTASQAVESSSKRISALALSVWSGHRAVRDLADEAQRSLGPHHEVRERVDGVLEVDERVEAVARRVLHAELVADARGERGVLAHRQRKRIERAHEVGPARAERGAARLLARVEHRPVREHDPHPGDRVIRVLRGAAAHAARVVGGDAADHRGVDRRGVRPELAGVRREPAVRFGADHARLQRHFRRAFADLAASPAVAEQHEHRVGDGLPREARARRRGT